MNTPSKFWNLQNWLITHKLKYLALFMYLCVMIVTVPCIWMLGFLSWLLETCQADIIGDNIKRICKGEVI